MKRLLRIPVFETLLVLFLFAGRFKADPRLAWVPVDLTALLFGVSLLAYGLRCAELDPGSCIRNSLLHRRCSSRGRRA